MKSLIQQLALDLELDEDEQPAPITDRPTSALLRIPDPIHGYVWLVEGSLLAGKPEYRPDPGMTARLLAEGGPKVWPQWDEREAEQRKQAA